MQDWTPDELKAHLERGEKVFLKLWKQGCGPCKLSTPAIERIEAENRHNLVFGQISTDEYPEMFEIAETEILPVFFVFDESGLRGKLEGFKGIDRMKNFIADCLAGESSSP